jgi:septal ring factor EnvC (AmiA/AmiB activator)
MSALPEEPTPGQTGIILQNIYDTLREVKKDMATRDFVDGKFGSFNDRATRIEDDMKKLGEDNSKNTQELKTMITDRVNQVIADFDEEKEQLNRRIDDIIVNKADSEKQRKARTIGVYMAIFGAALSLIVSVATVLIVNTFNP